MDIINHCRLCTSINDPKIYFLYYTHDARLKHNELAFVQSKWDVHIFCAQNQHHDTNLDSFWLQNDANFIAWSHLKFYLKLIFIKSCIRNYATYRGKWMMYMKFFMAQHLRHHLDMLNNDKSGTLIGNNFFYLYEHEIHLKWTPIKVISKDVQVD